MTDQTPSSAPAGVPAGERLDASPAVGAAAAPIVGSEAVPIADADGTAVGSPQPKITNQPTSLEDITQGDEAERNVENPPKPNDGAGVGDDGKEYIDTMLTPRRLLRQRFKTKEDFRAARDRQRREARLLKITEEGELVAWKNATPHQIGRASQSIGLQLYFMFLRSSARYLLVWSLCVFPTLYVCLQPSQADTELEVSGLALLSLASFGNQGVDEHGNAVAAADRKVSIFGTSYKMTTITPLLSWAAAAGAMLYFFFCVYFEKTVVKQAEEDLDKEAITPGDFTVMVDFVPRELFENGKVVGVGQVAPERIVGGGGGDEDRTLNRNDLYDTTTNHKSPDDVVPASKISPPMPVGLQPGSFEVGGKREESQRARRMFTRERWATFQFGSGTGRRGGATNSGSLNGKNNNNSGGHYAVDLKAGEGAGESPQKTQREESDELVTAVPAAPQTNPFHRQQYAAELKRHFENLLSVERKRRQAEGYFVPPVDLGPPTVVEVALVRDWGGGLMQCKGLAELEQQWKDNEQDGEDMESRKNRKLRKRIDKMAARLMKKKRSKSPSSTKNLLNNSTSGGSSCDDVAALKQKEQSKTSKTSTDVDAEDEDEDPSCRFVERAYVTFQLSYDKELCVHLYEQSATSHLWRLLLQSKDKMFQGQHALRVLPAPEPTNLLWENQDLHTCEWLSKKLAVVFLTLLILAACAFGVIQAKVKEKETSDKSSTATCSKLEGGVTIVTLPKTAEDEAAHGTQAVPFTEQVAVEYLANRTARGYAGEANENVFTPCQCDSMGLGTLLQNEALRTACDEYFSDALTVLLLGTLMSLVVVVLNILLKNVLLSITSWERPATISLLEKNCVTKIFVAQFVNTAIIIVLLNARPFNSYSFGVTDGMYSDFTHRWHATVGAAVALTLAINVLSPHGVDVCKAVFQRWKTTCFANCCAATERDLAAAFEPPGFEYSARCGAVLNTIFATLLFAPGAPVLILFALLNFVFCYTADKFLVLRFCKRPPSYDEKVVKTLVEWLPYAFLLHGLTGVWMLGNPDVFPSNHVSWLHNRIPSQFLIRWNDGSTSSTATEDADLLSTFADRATRQSGFPFLCVLCLVVYYFLLNLLKTVLEPFLCGLSLNDVFCFCFVNAGAEEEKKIAREGFAEDETTFLEQKTKWRSAKICAGYKLSEHPVWGEFRQFHERNAGNLAWRVAGSGVRGNGGAGDDVLKEADRMEITDIETLDTFEQDELGGGNEGFYQDFYSSSEEISSVDDE
mmetsp:Transcript_27086/g.68318  ORF Transcript_27086/g.68318 Transcript_27086/m.68318 type:complete len:1252 (-) Transcript_27086:318-4073(-)